MTVPTAMSGDSDQVDELAPADQQIAWTVATVLLDIIPAWGDVSARYMLEKLPSLPGDEPMARALAAHSEADAREILTTFRAGIDRRAHETPVEALEHARYLLQRGVGLGVLMDAYRLGFAMFREVLAVELRANATSVEQRRRLVAAADAYSFPFITTTTNRLAFEFGSLDGGWAPSTADPALARTDSLEAAHQLRADRLAIGAWVPDAVEHSHARVRAAESLRAFVRAIAEGVHDGGLDDRVSRASTTVTLTLADEPDCVCTLLLDRSPIEIEEGAADGECELSIASVDLERIWSRDFHLPMAIARGRVGVRGPIRKFLRVVPILRSAGVADNEQGKVNDAG
jgi:hypothetical protein